MERIDFLSFFPQSGQGVEWHYKTQSNIEQIKVITEIEREFTNGRKDSGSYDGNHNNGGKYTSQCPGRGAGNDGAKGPSTVKLFHRSTG